MNTTDAFADVPLDGDERLTCVECRAPFLFTAHERAWYGDMGYQPPKRCKPCRFAKRQRYMAIERAVQL